MNESAPIRPGDLVRHVSGAGPLMEVEEAGQTYARCRYHVGPCLHKCHRTLKELVKVDAHPTLEAEPDPGPSDVQGSGVWAVSTAPRRKGRRRATLICDSRDEARAKLRNLIALGYADADYWEL